MYQHLVYILLLWIGGVSCGYAQSTDPRLIHNWPPSAWATDTLDLQDHSAMRVPGGCLGTPCDDRINRDLYDFSLANAPQYTVHLNVHVFRDDNGQNGPSLSSVEDMLRKTQEDFSGYTADTAGYGSGYDTGIRFCWTLHIYDSSEWMVGSLEPTSNWIRRNYNTWGGTASLDVLVNDHPHPTNIGQSYHPVGMAGAVNHFVWVRSNVANGTRKTLSHEIGHYFGLYHPWARRCAAPCEETTSMSAASRDSVNDYCGDTDPDRTLNSNHPGPSSTCGNQCDNSPNTCQTFNNIMQYTAATRSVLFTPNQIARMRCFLVTLNTPLLVSTSPSCTEYPTADFYSDRQIVCLGDPIQFTDQSTSDVMGWRWDLGDGTLTTQQNPLHTYTQPGVYTVSLLVTRTGNQTSNTYTRTGYIQVVDSGVSLPYRQDFNSLTFPPGDWSIDPGLDSWKWFRGYAGYAGRVGVLELSNHAEMWIADPLTNQGSYLNSSLGAVRIAGSNPPESNSLYSPFFDFSQVANPELRFYYAHLPSASPDSSVTDCPHNWLGLNPQDTTRICNPAFCFGVPQPAWYNENLKVEATTDCGASWQYVLFDETGPDLNTVSGSPCDILAFCPLDSSQWRREVVDLCDLAGYPKVQFRFRHTSDFGSGELYIDEVEVVERGAPYRVYAGQYGVGCRQGNAIYVNALGATPPLSVKVFDHVSGWDSTVVVKGFSGPVWLNPAHLSGWVVSDAAGNCVADTGFVTIGRGDCKTMEVGKAELQIFPNPADESVSVRNLGEHCWVEVVDLLGRSMISFELEAGKEWQIEVSGWKAGIYLVRARDREGHLQRWKLRVD